MSFYALGVNPALVKTLTKKGINDPFPIQQASIPDAIAGKDLLGQGQTGSGKTLAFGLSLLTRLAGQKAKPHKPLALILAPTRELAMQIHAVVNELASAVELKVQLVVGGVSYRDQIHGLKQGATIVIATPGRLIDLQQQHKINLSEVKVVILDEADQMADMGFLPIVKQIMDLLPKHGQRMLYSATLEKGVNALVDRYLKDPVSHSVDSAATPPAKMTHHLLLVHPDDKAEITYRIAARTGKTIMFVRTKHSADRLSQKLAAAGIPNASLHGGKSQAVRTRTLNEFKSGKTPVLVATDLAARGIHVDDISLVVHVDAPTDPKDYLHRSGRTARAGEEGVVVTLTSSNAHTSVVKLTKQAGVDAEVLRVRPNTPEFISLTGAREPSRVPWTQPIPAEKPTKRRSGYRPNSKNRRRRPR